MPTLAELLHQTRLPRSELRAILAQISGFSQAQLISRDDYRLSAVQYQCFLDWSTRLAAGEPLAYVLGYKEFYSRNFQVNRATLIPRPETELLVTEAIKRAPHRGRVVDLGTGSGCIAITLKLERPDLDIIAVDQSELALTLAKANGSELNALIDWRLSDWYSAVSGCEFDVILSNPPYIEAGDEHLAALSYEPLSALTDFGDGLSCLAQISRACLAHLKPSGWLLVEHGYLQAGAVSAMFQRSGLANIVTIKDYANLARICGGQKL